MSAHLFLIFQGRRAAAPTSPPNDGLSAEEFRHLVDACDLLDEWRPQVGLLAQLGLRTADFRRLVENRPEVFQTGEATMRRKLQFLRDAVGLSQEEVAKVIVKFPRILEYRSEETVRPRLAFLEKVGVLETDIAKVVVRAPMIMALSLTDTLEPRAAFLREEVGLADGRGGLGKLIARHPQVLTCSEDMMRQRTKFLGDDCGLSPSEIARAVLAHPQILHYKIDSMKQRVDYLEKYVGMSKKQIAAAVARFPQIFSLAIASNLAPKWRYLVEHLGGDVEAICAYPGYFSLSLANRIIPRHKYLQLHRGGEGPMPFPLGNLKMADKKFATEVANTPLLEYEEFKEQLLQRDAAEAALATIDEGDNNDDDDDDDHASSDDSEEESCGGATSEEEAASWGVLPVRQPASSSGNLLGARLYNPSSSARNGLTLRTSNSSQTGVATSAGGGSRPLIRRAHPQ